MKGLEPSHRFRYKHLKLVRLLASVFIPRIEGLRSALSLRSRLPECVRLQGSSDRVARVWYATGAHLAQKKVQRPSEHGPGSGSHRDSAKAVSLSSSAILLGHHGKGPAPLK